MARLLRNYSLCFTFQTFLKNVVSAVLSRRVGFKVREKRFKHALGTQEPPATVRNHGTDAHDELR